MAADRPEELKLLCEAYAEELPGKIVVIKSKWQHLLQHSEPNHFADLVRQVHGLIGSGATFGFVKISQVAAEMEQLLRSIQDNPGQLTVESDRIQFLLAALESAAKDKPDYTEPETSALLPYYSQGEINVSGKTPTLVLISDNSRLVEDLSRKLDVFDIKTIALNLASNLVTYIQQYEPSCVLIELTSLVNRRSEIAAITLLKQGLFDAPKIIVISSCDDMTTRLASVRAGADAFFSYPDDSTGLIDHLEAYYHDIIIEPYRILIVDDDVQYAHHTALLLQREGIETEVVDNPLQIMEPLNSFRPDVILLDLHMPQCSGIELAIILHQRCEYDGISIVFLSIETDIALHVDALKAGGNDFIIKGIDNRHLITKTIAKAKHARALQRQMLHDTLTGLLNRSHYQDYLNRLIAGCQRENGKFAYAILDLDYFKKINDKYGHQAGDEVLKGVTKIISDRLRANDIAIRYGGEEIVLLFPNTDANEAVKLINELLIKIRSILFYHGDISFNVTFSGGIADYPTYTDIISLAEAADTALYQAKNKGRNQICIADYCQKLE
jgi:diguanylate cyclase (GGDEF)-like protein